MDSPMPPDSPRPTKSEDEGVYRSIFQQPLVDVPPNSPSYTWFEFVLRPETLEGYLESLPSTDASAAMELIREFLDQAQLVTDEGNNFNKRYKSLLRVAAQVALHMQFSIPSIEKALPHHFQRLLVDGVVDFAEDPPDYAKIASKQLQIKPHEAYVMHRRWALRALVAQSESGYLTASTRIDAEDLTTNFQTALSDIESSHSSIASKLHSALVQAEDDNTKQLDMPIKMGALYDLGMYYFAFGAPAKAYECLTQVSKLLDQTSIVVFTEDEQSKLRGFLEACEAMQGSQVESSLSSQIVEAWEQRKWTDLFQLLTQEMGAEDAIRLPPGHRQSMEQQALSFSKQIGDPSAFESWRTVYKKLATSNAVAHLVQSSAENERLRVERCANVLCALVQDEVVHASSSHTNEHVNELLSFMIRVLDDAHTNSREGQVARILERSLHHLHLVLPVIASAEGAVSLFEKCHLSIALTQKVDELMAVETHMSSIAERQRQHAAFAADLASLFVLGDAKESVCSALEQQFHTLAQEWTLEPSTDIVTFLMLHNRPQTLAQWKMKLVPDSPMLQFVEYALALHTFMDYALPAESEHGATTSFSLENCCWALRDLLLKRRVLVSPTTVVDVDEVEVDRVLFGLPLDMLETMASACAGLLHRCQMRSLSDYRISFDLTPYGDLSLFLAFASEPEDTGDEVRAFMKHFQSDLVVLHKRSLRCLLKRRPREPRWHCAQGDLLLNPITRHKSSSTSDPREALKEYLLAASLATNYFSELRSVLDIIDQSSLVRMSQCLMKLGAHVPAAVLYQCFSKEEFKYGLRLLQLAPATHDSTYFQYFWEMPFLELLVHLHSRPQQSNAAHVTLLTQLLQTPEINSTNPSSVLKELEQRVLRCFFRDLCTRYVGSKKV